MRRKSMRKPVKGMTIATATRIHNLRCEWRQNRATVYSEYRKGFYMVKAYRIFSEELSNLEEIAKKYGFTTKTKTEPGAIYDQLLSLHIHIPYDNLPSQNR